jgi:hypothetical protein
MFGLTVFSQSPFAALGGNQYALAIAEAVTEVVVPAPIDAKYWTVRYEKLVPLLIEAIKELDQEKIEIKSKL